MRRFTGRRDDDRPNKTKRLLFVRELIEEDFVVHDVRCIRVSAGIRKEDVDVSVRCRTGKGDV